MTGSVLIIPGTFAPSHSKVYYKKLIELAHNYAENVHFEPISRLGLGNVSDATKFIARKYLARSQTKCIVIGHSQGGIIGHLLAIQFPELVESVITLASPTRGTNWVDPVNMPIHAITDTISLLSRGKIRLRPAIRRFVVPVMPIVRDLTAYSDVNHEITGYLHNQLGGHATHAFIGTHDLAVFPHRSANPVGPLVTNYIVAPTQEYNRLRLVLPKDIVHINASAGHVRIVFSKPVLAKIESLLATSR